MIPIKSLSSSGHSCHNMCEAKYFGEYVLGWRGPSNIKSDQGTIIHKVLEVLAAWKLCSQNNEQYFNDEILGQCFINNEFKYVEVNNNKLTIQDILDNIFSYYTNKERTDHTWSKKEYNICNEWLFRAIEFNNGQFHPFNQNIVSPELRFDIEIRDDWAKYEYELNGEKYQGQLVIKGIIDSIIKIDDYTHEIIDFKTGRRLDWANGKEKTYEYLHNDFQLRLYHYAHMVLYPNIDNVLITIYFINDGGPFTLAFGRQDIPDTLDMIKKKFEHIRNTERPKPNYTWKCKKFCHFGKQTFDGTGIKPLIAKNSSRLSKPGEIMCMCDQILYTIENRSIDLVCINMTKENHKIGKTGNEKK